MTPTPTSPGASLVRVCCSQGDQPNGAGDVLLLGVAAERRTQRSLRVRKHG
jgi:hypothetical protein